MMTVHYSRKVCDQCNTSECRMGDSGARVVVSRRLVHHITADLVNLGRLKSLWKDAERALDDASRDYHTAKCALEQNGWTE